MAPLILRNASDAIADSDNDGWDMDRDGFVTPDRHLLVTSIGERRLVPTRNIWFILTMDPG